MATTVAELQEMEVNQITDLLEEKLGQLPMEIHLKLALLVGAGDSGIRVYPDLGFTGESPRQETLDWQKLADLINKEDS
jgi:hypothetical protein